MNFKQIIRPLLIGALLAASVFLLHHRGLLDALELKSLDLRFKMRGPLAPQLPIVLVSIDQDSFDELGLSWPWPRTLHAELIRKLAKAEAKVIAFDVLFTAPKADGREDRALADAIRDAGNVILAAEHTMVASDFGPRETLSLPIPLIREHAMAYGIVNLIRDRDAIVRRGRPALRFQDQTFLGFAQQIHEAAAGKESVAGKEVSTAPTIINFRGPARTYPVVPYYRILRDEIDPALLRDKIVLVGNFSPSEHDVFPTPFSARQQMAGVEIQANFVETLAAGDPIVPFSRSGHAMIFILLSVTALGISIYFGPWQAVALVLALNALYAFAGLYLFANHELWIPLLAPMLAVVLSYGGITVDSYIREQKERLRTRAILSRYVSPDVAEELLKTRASLGFGGQRRHITVLFSDIRGFTSISEQIAPEQVVSLLSDYLARVTHIVFKHEGTIDKFIGDAVFAIFGAPKSHSDDALRAVKAGIEMIELVEALAPKWTEMIGRPLKVGVGINSGDAVVGSIGSEIRSDFTAIGDTVNLGARLEALTKELGVPMLLSEHTAMELKDSIHVKPLRLVKVQGREAPLMVYCPESLVPADIDFDLETTAPYVQQKK